ncbi:flagellar biosynthesis protein FlhB [Nisaea acidiphila]|uniref:Flagellar biosynthetic protein FlhB n=1 Tax=Nisaea acidiphila TaxID=1862145 RepID=A0A9J7AUG6_9PROT|nr:flagellar biosynthesis protein FlhB [Nisaea acidiphila]UUX50466.1 flagellar biosynthesis protein FlhB [Nisaea acidiphila]
MSGQDDGDKTEEPSARKLSQAREKGQVLTSKEVNNFAVLLGATMVVGIFGPFLLSDMARALLVFIERPDMIDVPGAGSLLLDMLIDVGFAIAPALALLFVLAILGVLMQIGWLVSTESIQPKLEKISPISGAKRLFSLKSVMELVKGIVKMMMVGFVAYLIVSPEFSRIEMMVQMDIKDLLDETHFVAIKVFIGALAVTAVIAVADYLYQKYEFMNQMRMSKQEVRDEHKQTEGDPHVKARLRQLRMERARTRMMAEVPKATVVITNPTHFAVALKYEMDEMSAPRVLAKGVDAVALRIREVANENDVPIVENRPLARALYDNAEIDEEIPEEYYKAVAEVISYVFKMNQTYIPTS